MTKKTKKTTGGNNSVVSESLARYVRKNAHQYLSKPNINSVGIGYKMIKGKRTRQLSIQFTVNRKVALEGLESLNTPKIPQTISVDGLDYPTDVLERTFDTSARVVKVETKLQKSENRKVFIDPIVPGVSVGHPSISAGTAGCVTYDAQTGEPLLLSNWHVLHGPDGNIGDPIVQPGSHDDNRTQRNLAGRLVRSHLGIAGDCAVAEIDHRGLDNEIVDLGISIDQVGEPELDDRVIKSGRTTAVTHGIVTRVNVTVKIDYGSPGDPNLVEIGCFEIEPDPKHPAARGEISMGGDSGSAWVTKTNGRPTTMMVGLHFAGEVGNAPEHALACYPGSVFEKLSITPVPLTSVKTEEIRRGFSTTFVGGSVFMPRPLTDDVANDLLRVDGETVFHYTHFSLAMSRSRKLALWVAWNIDGSALRRISRKGINFKKDQNLPSDAQHGNELYRNNRIDRSHIARRADLTWGPLPEARQANVDSFYFTNISPQHETFNQSSAGGIWGQLENAVFADVELEDARVSVIGGPIFAADDPVYRGVPLPKSFWKTLYFREAGQSTVRVRAYVLTQADLLNQLEILELPEFAVFEVTVNELQDITGIDLRNAKAPKQSGSTIEAMDAGSVARLVESVNNIIV